eukprot:COSAG01_NODE_133_length_24549_cov_27.573333_3_plen_1122_part_00
MATYIPGVQSYLPNFQPFTPDYKFLSNVLDVKTQKYNTNYKAVNDLYSKVVYGDLSRGDTQAMRDQFANNLGPKLQQISGMDLSVMQNSEAAKGIFRPFFEEDLIVKDLVTTRQYKNEMQKVNMMQNAPNREERSLYWQTGVQKMGYEMQDFINASEEEALKMRTPKYTANANLYEEALNVLKESGLEAKIDQPSEDGLWVIKRENGDLITKQALQMVQRTLQNDPRVVQAYHADAFVRSRQFAEKGVEEGSFSSIDEGETAWATEQIGRMEQLIADRTSKLDKQKTEQKAVVVSWENYKKQYGVAEGTKAQKEMNEALSKYDALEMALQSDREALADNKGVNTQNKQSLLNRAYSLIMNHNMQSDLQAAAISYSNIGKKVGLEANVYGKMKVQAMYDAQRDARKHAYKLKEIKAEEESEAKNSSGSMDFMSVVKTGEAGTLDSDLVNEDGTLDLNADFIKNQQGRVVQLDGKVNAKAVDVILKTIQNTQNNGTGRYTVAGFTGSLPELRDKLLETDANGIQVHSDLINQEFANVGNILKVSEADRISLGGNKAPAWLASDGGKEYMQVLKDYNDVRSTKSKVDVVQSKLYNIMKGNLDKAMFTDIIGVMEGGEELFKVSKQQNAEGEYMPNIFYENEKGVTKMYTKAEYAAAFEDWARKGGTSSEDTFLDDTYLLVHNAFERSRDYDDNWAPIGWGHNAERPSYKGGPIGGPIGIRGWDPGAGVETGNARLDDDIDEETRILNSGIGLAIDKDSPLSFQKDISDKAAYTLYNKLYELANYTMTGGFDSEVAEIKSSSGETAAHSPMFQTYDVNQAMRGVSDKNMTAGELASNPVYSVNVDPLALEGDSYDIFRSLFEADQQLSKSQGKHVIAYDVTKGDEDDRWNIFTSEWDEESEIFAGDDGSADDAVRIGRTLLDEYYREVKRMQQKGATKSDYPNATIEYLPSISADPSYASTKSGMDGNAGYKVKLSQDFISKYKGTLGIADEDLYKYQTISVVIPKKEDKNPLRFGEFNFSSYAVDISNSQDSQAVEVIPKGGKLRVLEDASGNYQLYVDQIQFNTGSGNLEYMGETHVTNFLDSNGNPMNQSNRSELDLQIQKYLTYLEAVSLNNAKEYEAQPK